MELNSKSPNIDEATRNQLFRIEVEKSLKDLKDEIISIGDANNEIRLSFQHWRDILDKRLTKLEEGLVNDSPKYNNILYKWLNIKS